MAQPGVTATQPALVGVQCCPLCGRVSMTRACLLTVCTVLHTSCADSLSSHHTLSWAGSTAVHSLPFS